MATIYNDVLFRCITENGYDFQDIHIPLVKGWLEVEFTDWQPVEYAVWDVVKYDNAFYTLLHTDDFDNNINPFESDNWGAIADYLSGYNDYELCEHEYVVYKGRVFHPETDVNADIPQVGV